jgi:hypothetical protein
MFCTVNYHYYIGPVQLVFAADSLQRFAVIEPAVQLVRNGRTIEPSNRRPHRFDDRSGPNNYEVKTRVPAAGSLPATDPSCPPPA